MPELFYLSEDWDFCNKARQAGLKVYFHSGVLLGHMKDKLLHGAEVAKLLIQKHQQGMTRPLVQSSLLPDAAEFLGLAQDELANKLSEDWAAHFADEWNQKQGSIDDFYKHNESGFYDLLKFNASDAYWSDRVAPLDECTDKNILEIGCGLGSVALYLASKRNSIVGYDLNPRLLEFAKFRQEKFGFSNITFMDSLPPRYRFNLIVAIDTLEHIEDLRGFLINLADGMKSGTKFYHADVFERNEKFPQHFDHSENIDGWLEEAGFVVFDKRWAIRK